jgi:F0F1-type ATP synthase assembly protein I
MPEGPAGGNELAFYYGLAQVGLEMVAPIGIGLAVDYLFGWLPWATVVCAVVGFVGGMAHLVLMVQQHDSEERRRPPGEAPR